MKVQDRAPERLGPYRLLRRLGEGGMGVVYLAVDAAGQPVAVKALHPLLAQEGTARQRLAREVETMRRIRSRYVAEVLDADLGGDPPYIVTRYVPGLTLDQVIGNGGPLSGQPLYRLACGLAQALAAVHSAGVVHRDLKPGNVMISDGEPVVIDFGIAQLPDASRLTMTGMFMGTPGFLAPEVIEGLDSGTASDVHSLGATLAFAATGRPPFGGGSYEAIFYRIMHGQPDLDTLPAALGPVISAALAREPSVRPSAAQVATELARLDPAALVPSPSARPFGPAVTGQAGGFGNLPGTVTDGAGGLAAVPGGPNSTRPLSPLAPDDMRDLLPPVQYGNGRAAVGLPPSGPLGNGAPGHQATAAGPGGAARSRPPAAGGWASAGPAPGAGVPVLPGSGRPAGGPGAIAGGSASAPRAQSVSPWSPLIFAIVASLVAISVMAPIVGTVIALSVLVALRAASTTVRQMGRRRSGDGPRPSDPVVAAALYPVALLRSLAGLLLVAPVGLLAFAVAAAATIIAVPAHPLPRAAAFGAGALVAIAGLGPGSAGARQLLARALGSAARTPSRLAIAYVGVLALAAWAGLTAWTQSQAPAYWPVASLHAQIVHLPTIRSVLTDVRLNLLRIARHLGI